MSALPDAPQALWVERITPAGVRRRVVLQWTPVPTAVAYRVRLAGGEPPRDLTFTACATADQALACAIYVTPGTWLVAQVAAVDATGRVSAFSPLVEVTVE